MKDYLKLMLVVIASLFAGAYLNKCQSPPGDLREATVCATDTVKVVDTIRYYSPKPLSELPVGFRRYTLPSYETGISIGLPQAALRETDIRRTSGLHPQHGGEAAQKESGITAESLQPSIREAELRGDSVEVELPVIQRHYADSTYEAWVSGPVDPRLDSLRVFSPTTIITKREWKPPKHWHIGPSVGFGYTPQGFQPYFGISVMYSIFSF